MPSSPIGLPSVRPPPWLALTLSLSTPPRNDPSVRGHRPAGPDPRPACFPGGVGRQDRRECLLSLMSYVSVHAAYGGDTSPGA